MRLTRFAIKLHKLMFGHSSRFVFFGCVIDGHYKVNRTPTIGGGCCCCCCCCCCFCLRSRGKLEDDRPFWQASKQKQNTSAPPPPPPPTHTHTHTYMRWIFGESEMCQCNWGHELYPTFMVCIHLMSPEICNNPTKKWERKKNITNMIFYRVYNWTLW